jgi:hypothetical protein
MLEDEQFHAAVQSVNERLQLHLASVQPLLERTGSTVDNYYLLHHLASALGPRLTDMIRLATDEAYLHVGKSCESSPKLVEAAAKSFREIFPKHKFFYFAPKSKIAVNRDVL